MFYADGSALRLTVGGIDGSPAVTGTASSVTNAADAGAWRAWFAQHEGQVAVSELSLTELRRAADPLGPEAREAASDLAQRLHLLRISDQSLPVATHTEAMLGSFAALHLGIALAAQNVRTLLTYDCDLARLARMYALEVFTPGRADGWWE